MIEICKKKNEKSGISLSSFVLYVKYLQLQSTESNATRTAISMTTAVSNELQRC